MTTGKVDIELDTRLDTKADDNWHNIYNIFLPRQFIYKTVIATNEHRGPTSDEML